MNYFSPNFNESVADTTLARDHIHTKNAASLLRSGFTGACLFGVSKRLSSIFSLQGSLLFG